MADNTIIGSRIKMIREEKGFTQEELANALGLNKSTIQRYETAKIEKIKLPVIDAIAQKLNVNPEWLTDKTDVRSTYRTSTQPAPDIDTEVTGTELSENEREMIDIFKGLTPTQQGKLIERAKIMSEDNETDAITKENAS